MNNLDDIRSIITRSTPGERYVDRTDLDSGAILYDVYAETDDSCPLNIPLATYNGRRNKRAKYDAELDAKARGIIEGLVKEVEALRVGLATAIVGWEFDSPTEPIKALRELLPEEPVSWPAMPLRKVAAWPRR